jgi:hypothetical protein
MPEISEWDDEQVDDVFDEGDFITVNQRVAPRPLTEMERDFFQTINRARIRNVGVDFGRISVSNSDSMTVDLSEPEPSAPRHLNRDLRQINHKPAMDKQKVCEVIIDDILDI